ncbi:hypothetical protein QZH41_012489, partial [Actinostola sp. cb2023]
CRDSFCQNGGVCNGGPNVLSCKCPKGFTGTYCQKSQCGFVHKCQNGGTCAGLNTCVCPPDYTGPQCNRKRLGTKLNPAPNAQAILDAGDSLGSGLYWIQPPVEEKSAQTYCDMTYSDGGWMLASYGYVGSKDAGSTNKAIPNMNNPMGYAWRPARRAGLNGVINLPHGAVMMARNATYMIMAAGNNPTTGIDGYAFVYRIDLRQNTYNITFANHNRYHGAVGTNGIPKMHVTDFLVVGLKGDLGEFERFALGESLGVTWADSYPTGYGFNDIGKESGTWDKGPFFPSVHSGDGHSSCSSGPCRTYQPDVSKGSESYVHRGWYTASGTVGKTGQTSIWFK